MATYTVTIVALNYSPWFSVSPSSLAVNNGDTVTFTNAANSSQSIGIENFDSGEWTNTSNISVSIGTSSSKVANTGSGSDTLNFFHYYLGTKRNFSYTIVFGSVGQSNKMYFGHATGAIPLSDIRDFFRGPPESTVYQTLGSTASISEYYKGGSYVPNITENANIPTSGTIDFSDFRSSATTFSIESLTASKSTFKSTANTGQTYTGLLEWYILDNVFTEDMETGYSEFYKSDIEYYCTLQVSSTQNPSEPCILTPNTPTSWTHIDNTDRRFGVQKTVVGLDFTYNYGTITIYARPASFPTAVATASASWVIQFQGP